MKDIFLSALEISLSTSVVILGLLLFSQVLNKRYVAKWKYFIWIALALRLAVPVKLELPRLQQTREIVFEMPARIAAPIVQTTLPVTHQAPGVTPLDVLALVWLIGCGAFLLVHLGSYLRYRRRVVVHGVRVRDLEILRLVRSLSRELGISGGIPVRTYEGASSPMVLGFCRPILVLPEMDYRTEELGFILRHELIHLKRHDIFFKLLFVIANAVHWFNPVIYWMQKEAVVDMELSCDETVIQGTGYEDRKAYTETLLSTLCRQHTRNTTLSTQFYGGKQVMKKRFKNILHRAQKKNGLLVLVIAICTMLVLGSITGCSVAKENAPEPQVQETVADSSQTPVEETEQQETNAYTESELSAASHVAFQFASACIRNDTTTMKTHLSDTFEGMPEAYFIQGFEFEEGINISAVYRAGDISLSRNDAVSIFSETVPVGSTVTLIVPMEEGIRSFIVGLVRQEEGWKVKDYFIEQASGETAQDDNQQIAEAAQAFATAYFGGDREAIKSYLAQSYDGDYDVYTDYAENVGTTISDMSLKGLPEPRQWQLWDKIGSVSLEYRNSREPDSYEYLSMYFIKEETGWKIYFYGIEK